MATPAGAPARLQMLGITKSFGHTRALGGVDLEVMPGEVHALVGENGAGKSTLVKVLSGAHAADGGRMLLDGQPYAPRDPQEALARGVGMIYQELAVAPHLTVAENVALGAEPRRGPWLDREAARALARRTLGDLGHGDIDVDAPAGSLSLGRLQIVEIARSISRGCRVIVFDEPTSSLAQEDARRLFRLIGRLAGRGIAVIYISHFLEEVRRLASRLTILRDGQSVGTHAVGAIADDRIVAAMVGRDVRELYPRSPRRPGDILLRSRVPGRGDLEVRRGEVLGICGLVGSGRTELLRGIFGLDPGGLTQVGGHTVPPGPRAAWASGMGYVSENRKEEGLALALGIGDNICLPSLRALGRAGLVSPAARSRRTLRWIADLGIRCEGPDQPVGRLSGGNQQKVALARLLEADSDILLLDEPTRGIDIAAKARLYEAVDRLVTDPARPRAVVMVSSHLPELLGTCDRIAVMGRRGLGPARPVAETTPETLMAEATAHS
ncbi:MAG: sugar ABC transporter ATP-binding protein [Opitutia bacterium]